MAGSIAASADSGMILLENKKETTGLKAEKIWSDDNNSQNLRPENVRFKLYRTKRLLETEPPGENSVTVTVAWQNNIPSVIQILHLMCRCIAVGNTK